MSLTERYMLILSTKSTKTSGAGLHRGGGERKNDRDLKMDNGKVDERNRFTWREVLRTKRRKDRSGGPFS